jgi:hypothetical protein
MKSSKLRLFADDSIIYKTIKSQKDCDSLQEDIDAAARWESDWLMAFHPDKCSEFYCNVPECEGPKLSMHALVLDGQEIGMPATTVNTFREQLTPTVLSHLQSQI